MRRTAAAWWVALVAVGTASGCADEQEALIVLHSVPADVSDEGCSWDPASDATLASGTLDVAAGTGYRLAPVLLNNLPARTDTNSGVDDSELQLTSRVDVSLRIPADVVDRMGNGPNGEPVPLSFQVPIATDSLGPGERYVALMDAITDDHAVALQPAVDPDDEVVVQAEVVFHATRTGNSRGDVGVIDSRVYSYPITLCNGCLRVSCACDGQGQCLDGTSSFFGICGRAQDGIPGGGFDCGALDVGTSTGGDESSTGAPLPPSGSSTGLGSTGSTG